MGLLSSKNKWEHGFIEILLVNSNLYFVSSLDKIINLKVKVKLSLYGESYENIQFIIGL